MKNKNAGGGDGERGVKMGGSGIVPMCLKTSLFFLFFSSGKPVSKTTTPLL